MNTELGQLEAAITSRGISNPYYLDDGYDTYVFRGKLYGQDVLVKAYYHLAQCSASLDPITVIKWYFEIGKRVRADLNKNPNPLGQKITVDNQEIELRYACADFGLLTQQGSLLISVVRHPVPGKSLANGIADLGLQDYWSETPSSDIERNLKDLANTTLQDLASRLNFPSQKIDPTNVKIGYDNESKVLNLSFTDIYARMLKAYQ